MGEFSWAYISGGAGNGPSASVQFIEDGALSGTSNFTYNATTNMLAITGSMEISGTLSANQYNINVVDKTVINLSASGDTVFGDTFDDTHQFTGSVLATGSGHQFTGSINVSGNLSSSALIYARQFHGDGSNLTNIDPDPAGANTQVQFNNDGVFGASANLTFGGSALKITGSILQSGSGVEKVTTLNNVHISSSLNISGSNFYGNDAELGGDLYVGRYIYHQGDPDTKIEFGTDDIAISAGNREFIKMTEASTDTIEFNRVTGNNFKFIVNNSENEIFSIDDAGVVINEGGAPDDFRVESNTKQRAFYIDGDDQTVQVLVDTEHGAFLHLTGSDTAVFISGSIGSKGTSKKGVTVFGGDVVISGTLHGGSALDIGSDGITVSGSAVEKTTTINTTHVSSSLNISGSAFYGDGSNLTNIPAAAVGAAGADNQIQFNDDGDLEGNANLIFRGNSDLVVTGSLILTGSSQSLIVLDTRDADNLKEIVFNKDGSAAAAIQLNSSEHLFVENENAKDIILRANNQNALRVIGSQRKVIIGSVTKTSATAELDVEGDAYVSGSLTVSGSSTIGLGANHQSTFGGGLTASLGVSLGQNSFVATDKNILFGSQGNSAVQYNNSAAQLVISGSSGANGGINFQGNNIQFDLANGTIKTGSLAGGKSYLGVDTNGRLVLTGSVDATASPAGSDEQIQFNNGGAFGASAALSFDSARSELELAGSMEIVSGSGAAERTIFEVNSGLTPGASGSVRGRMLHTIIAIMDLTSGAQARTGRYVSLGPVTSASQTLTRNNGFISPFSGRLVSITYHFPAGATNQDQSKGQCGFAFKTADVNTLNGSTMDSAATNTGHVTASTWPGTNRVGSINVQTGAGALGGLANVTGTFSFGTGSAVGLFFQSGDSSGVNFPGQCAFTIVFELDQIDQIVSGSGN